MPRPTSTHDQREAVRALALQVGVREAARRLGLNVDRVMQWSARYNWLPQPVPNPHNDAVSIVSKVADHLAEYGKTTKLAIAHTADKAAARFETMPADKIIDRADKLVAVTKVASTIHGWDTAQPTSALNLNVLSGGRAIVQVNETKGANDT